MRDERRVAVSVASGENVGVGRRETFVTVNGVNENVPNVFARPLARDGTTDIFFARLGPG